MTQCVCHSSKERNTLGGPSTEDVGCLPSRQLERESKEPFLMRSNQQTLAVGTADCGNVSKVVKS